MSSGSRPRHGSPRTFGDLPHYPFGLPITPLTSQFIE
jgi:hypothetical protein